MLAGATAQSVSLALFEGYYDYYSVHVTARDLKKSFIFDKAVKIIGHVHFFIRMWTRRS